MESVWGCQTYFPKSGTKTLSWAIFKALLRYGLYVLICIYLQYNLASFDIVTNFWNHHHSPDNDRICHIMFTSCPFIISLALPTLQVTTDLLSLKIGGWIPLNFLNLCLELSILFFLMCHNYLRFINDTIWVVGFFVFFAE